MATTEELTAAAHMVLASCRRDGFVAPSPSATHHDPWTTLVVCLAGALSPEDAAADLELLLDGPEDRPAPGAESRTPATPPLHASAAMAVAGRLPDHGRPFLARLWEGLVAHHRSLLEDYDPDGIGLIGLPVAVDRPFMTDRVVVNSVFVRANRDLAEAAGLLGYNPRPFEAWAQRTRDAVDRDLWNEGAGRYTDREAGPADVTGLTSLFGAIPNAERARRMAAGALPPPELPVPLAWLQWRGLRRYDLGEAADRWRTAICDAADAGFPPTVRSAGDAEPSAATAAVALRVLAEGGEVRSPGPAPSGPE